MLKFHKALMDLTVVDGEICCQDGQPFNKTAYSHFKYGWTPPAAKYGQGLATLVDDRLFELAGNEPIIIVSAPYKYLPTASHAIAEVLLRELSYRAISDGREPPVLVPIHKARAGSSSYAKSSVEDRLKSLATIGLHIDESRIPDSHVLVVDDIRITGSAERATAAYLEPLAPASIWYLHAARLPQDIGVSNPGLEDELNQAANHGLGVILDQVIQGEFKLNTRVLRIILEAENAAIFSSFVYTVPLNLLEEIYQAALGNGSVYYNRYSDNLAFIQDALHQRNPHSNPRRISPHAELSR